MYALYVTHPEVVIDPNVATPRWGLSGLGRSRAERFANHPLVQPLTRLVSSTETKALELAAILATGCGAPVDSGDKFDETTVGVPVLFRRRGSRPLRTRCSRAPMSRRRAGRRRAMHRSG